MYQPAYGIIETLAPLHVGATAGEETGNLNLIFRDQYTQTGIVPGSSIRGRLRAEMRLQGFSEEAVGDCYGRAASTEPNLQFESRVKLEHASIVWLPVFCPNQPIIWVSCPRLLRRYQRIVGSLDEGMREKTVPRPYTGSQQVSRDRVFFNFGFVTLKYPNQDLSDWFPLEEMFGHPEAKKLPAIVVDDNDIGMIHDMALYRQSRVALKENQKVVAKSAFFNVEALPEGTLLVFPAAIKPPTAASQDPREQHSEQHNDEKEEKAESTPEGQNGKVWQPFEEGDKGDLYLGGLESVGFGHCYITMKGL